MLRKLWSRVKALFAPLFRRVPVPGRYEADSRAALRGSLASSPWIWPSREYLVYVPRGHARWRRAPLVVLIHGCRQKAEDIAEGARITRSRRRARMPGPPAAAESPGERMALLELVRRGERERLGRDRDRRRASARGAPQVPHRPQARVRRRHVGGRRARRRARREAPRADRRRVHPFRCRVRRGFLRTGCLQRAETRRRHRCGRDRARGARPRGAAIAAGAAARGAGRRR